MQNVRLLRKDQTRHFAKSLETDTTTYHRSHLLPLHSHPHPLIPPCKSPKTKPKRNEKSTSNATTTSQPSPIPQTPTPLHPIPSQTNPSVPPRTPPKHVILNIHNTPNTIRAGINDALLRHQQPIEIDAVLISVLALQVRSFTGGAERVAGAVEGVEGLVAGAEGAGVDVDGVRGGVHFGAGVGQEAGPAGAVVVVHFAGAVEVGCVLVVGRGGRWARRRMGVGKKGWREGG